MVLYPVLLAALLGFCAAEDEGGMGGLFGGRLAGGMEPRLGINALRIHQLEEHIKKLHERIEEAKHVDPDRFLDDLDARLSTLEGDHCDDHEFQCGSSGQECVSDLFVCDGTKDCHNGHDEDEHVCSTAPVKSGNVFTGMTHWKDCILRDDHLTTLTITTTKRFKFFSSRVVVHAVASSSWKDKEGEEHTRSVELHGGYNFANRRLGLIPKAYGPDAPHLGLRCDFGHGDDERVDCVLLTQASLHECAELHLSLEHHEEDDHH